MNAAGARALILLLPLAVAACAAKGARFSGCDCCLPPTASGARPISGVLAIGNTSREPAHVHRR